MPSSPERSRSRSPRHGRAAGALRALIGVRFVLLVVLLMAGATISAATSGGTVLDPAPSGAAPAPVGPIRTALIRAGSIRTAQDPSDDGPVSAEAARDSVDEVMSRREFDYSPSTLERVFEWIGEQLSKLLAPGEAAAGGSFGGGIGTLFGWLIMVAAVVAIVVVAVWVISNRTRRDRGGDEEPLSPAEVEHRRRAVEWMDDAERLEADGRWKEALRARYRHLVRVLVDRRQLPDVPGRTTGELRDDLAATTPAAAADFDTCCRLFELAWYADAPTGPDENGRLRAAAARALDAPVEERVPPGTLLDIAGVARDPDGTDDRSGRPTGTDAGEVVMIGGSDREGT